MLCCLLLASSVATPLLPTHWETPSFSSINHSPLLLSPSSSPVLHNSYLYNNIDILNNIYWTYIPSFKQPCRSHGHNNSKKSLIVLATHFEKKYCEVLPVPMPSLRPPSRWLASRSRSQTVSSTQASFRSSALKPSYTMVWLNMGLVVFFNTLVFWWLFLLVSGSTKLWEHWTKANDKAKYKVSQVWTISGFIITILYMGQ